MRSTSTKSADSHSTAMSSSLSLETTQEQRDCEIHRLEPPRQRSFRRRSYPARSNSIDHHQEVPEIRPCHSTSDASTLTSTSTATTEACPSLADYARRSKKDAIVSPFQRFRRAKRRSSIATESTAHWSGETAPASFDSQGDVLHKHMHYGTPRTTTPSSSSSPSPNQGEIAPVPPPLQHHQHTSFVHPQKETMKRHRRDKTATFGMVGAGVGTLILPVVGTVVGGILSGYAANQSLKRYEKKIQRKWEREEFQRTASASQTARHAVFA